MRFHLVAMILMASVAVPAAAQRGESAERRIERLEQQLRAVQRRVFPNGAEVAPEIDQQQPVGTQTGVPASSAVADLTGRVDSLETQLRELTGQIEQNGNRLRQAEEALTRLRDSTGGRLDALERGGTTTAEPARPSASSSSSGQRPRPAAVETEEEEPAALPVPKPAAATTGDAAAEEAYNAGFRLWESKRYTEAQKALEAAAKRYPKSKWASWANNLAGRAYLDSGKPATAAKAFLANYQANPKGERAADSLYFLGQALVSLDKPADACKAYDELQDVYAATMRDWIKSRLPAARSQAKCR